MEWFAPAAEPALVQDVTLEGLQAINVVVVACANVTITFAPCQTWPTLQGCPMLSVEVLEPGMANAVGPSYWRRRFADSQGLHTMQPGQATLVAV